MKNRLCTIIDVVSESNIQPLTTHRPVVALPFACRYRIIDFLLSNVRHAEIDSVALFISGSGRSIYDHIRSGKSWDLDSSIGGGVFTFSQQDWKLANYSGDTEYYVDHLDFLRRSKSEYVFVAGGKILANVDIRAVLQHHLSDETDVTVVYKGVLKDGLEHRPNEVILSLNEESYVTSLSKVKDATLLASERHALNLNMYMISCEKLAELLKKAQSEGLYASATTVLETYLSSLRVRGFEYTGYHAILDSVKAYYDANRDMLDNNKFSAVFSGSCQIVTKAKNGVSTYYTDTASVKNAQFATDCYIEGHVENSLIFRKVHVLPGASIKNSLVLQGTVIEKDVQLNYVIVEKDMLIPEGVVLEGTPEAPLVVDKNYVF